MNTPATTPTETETMTVTVRDREAEPPWGHGPTTVATRQVTIGARCLECGARRGQPKGANRSEDGVYYWVQEWTNPCGHADQYAVVLAEARAHYPEQMRPAMRHG